VALQSIYNPWHGDDLVLDLDRDGRPEIASVGVYGLLQIYESTGDDVWERIYTDSTRSYPGVGRVAAGGRDTDDNGLLELFVGGENQTTYEKEVFIYEPDGDRSFRRVASARALDGASGFQSGAIAQLEPGGKLRFVWQVYRQLRFYVSPSPGVWELEFVINEPSRGHQSVYARDLNRNGRDEIYWVSSVRPYQSLVYERPTLPTDAPGEPQAYARAALRVWPSPGRGDATVFLDPEILRRARAYHAFDAAGRIAFEGTIGTMPVIVPLHRLRPGIYFLQVTGDRGRPLASGRTTVIR
jgi:hypothetical protein